jgi:5-formyltetrahydrofolate cyclo-ligase
MLVPAVGDDAEALDPATRKAALRQAARLRRRALDPVVARAADAAIRRRLAALLAALAPASVGLYAALPGEVDVDAVLDRLRDEMAVPAALPRVTGPGAMAFHAVEAMPPRPAASRLRGLPPIREPDPARPRLDPALVVVPGLAFDRRGGRLGHGGGFYDRWLAAHADVTAVGVCRAADLVRRVPRAPHDLPVDVVVTEDRVYR